MDIDEFGAYVRGLADSGCVLWTKGKQKAGMLTALIGAPFLNMESVIGCGRLTNMDARSACYKCRNWVKNCAKAKALTEAQVLGKKMAEKMAEGPLGQKMAEGPLGSDLDRLRTDFNRLEIEMEISTIWTKNI